MTRVFVLGDSHSSPLAPLLIEAAREHNWSLAGQVSRVGWSTARYANDDSWQPAISAARPDVVVVVLGTNDAAQSQPAYVAQLGKVVDGVRAAGASTIVWVGPPNVVNQAIDARIERIAPWQDAFLPQMGVTWIDSRPMTGGGHGPDGVHFTRSGYTAWAGALVDAIGQHVSAPQGSIVVPFAIAAVVVALFVATLHLSGKS